MKELLDSDRVNYLVWRFVVIFILLPEPPASEAKLNSGSY
jgi:hypothetical protein